MNPSLSKALTVLRLGMGWYFFYAGISKIIDPAWSAAGYLSNASTFPELFLWLAEPGRIEVVSIVNEWGLLLIGVSLIVGLGVRWASYAGIILMVLYWLPGLDFPHAGHGFIVDDHVIYVTVFVVLIAGSAGKYFGIDGWIGRHK